MFVLFPPSRKTGAHDRLWPYPDLPRCLLSGPYRTDRSRRLFEISQIRRRLPLLGRHEKAIPAQHVVLLADDDMIVGLGTVLLIPGGKALLTSPVVLHDRPGTRQRIVDHGDLVMGDVGVGFVDEDLLFDDAL